MKVLYDNIIFCAQKYGGVSRYFSEVIRRIAKYEDVVVDVFKGLSILPRRLSRFNKVLLDFKLLSHKYDIYHPTYYSNSIKKRKRIKTVVTVYDMIHELYAYKFEGINSGIEIKKNSILNADHIICISKRSKKDLQKFYGIKDDMISVVYLGVSSDEIDRAHDTDFSTGNRPFILHVGNRKYYKNFNTFLKAFSISGIKNDFNLVCFGGGSFSQEEISFFKKYNLLDSVKYIEGEDSMLKRYYRKAFMLAYPSFYEGFGLPILEAMANNCPVIASNGGSIPEIAGDAAMFFYPDKEEEISLCIKRMINDNDMRNAYIAKGKERVKGFTWDKTAMETRDVYKKVLDK